MKIDAPLKTSDLSGVPQAVAELEAQGFDGCVSVETQHDPFFPLLLAAEHSARIELSTSIAVAFARTPMTVANIGHDLNAYSKGRFILGLGSQIRPHITKRFSMPLNSWTVAPNRLRDATTCSPACIKLITTPRMADMPEEVATQHCAPSIAARRASIILTVGLVYRE